jgi:hypothetical protein
MKTIYDIGLHESIEVETTVEQKDGSSYTISYIVTKVVGGWLYKRDRVDVSPCFVPSK